MLITANNIVGGGDSWITDTDGSPKKWELAVGTNTLSITLPSTEWGYQIWAACADGQVHPKHKAPIINGTTMTVVFEGITSAQRGTGGHDCYVQIRIIK